MAKARVWNRHPTGLTHKENFKEREIVIPAGEHIVMDYEEAVQFRGQWFPMKKDAQGAPDPAGFKCIHIEPIVSGAAETQVEFISQIDGKKFVTKEQLDAHLKFLQESIAHLVVKDEMLDKEIAEEQVAKRGPGRPPKEKSA